MKGRIGLAAAVSVVAVAALVTVSAGAQSGPTTLADLCADRHPCLAINGVADPAAGGDKEVPVQEALASEALAPEACPVEREAWARLGMRVDAFIALCAAPPEKVGDALASQLAANSALAVAAHEEAE